MTEKIKILVIGTEKGKKDGIVYLKFKRERYKALHYFTIGINERYLKKSFVSHHGITLTIANYYTNRRLDFLYGHEHSINSEILDFLTNSDELIQNIGIEMLKIELKL